MASKRQIEQGKHGSGAAQNGKRAAASERDTVVWDGFLDLRLDDIQKDAFKQWEMESETDLSSMLEGIAVSGAKVSLSYSKGNDTFVAAMTGELLGKPAHTQTVSAFAQTMPTAMSLLCFKHYVMAREDWTSVDLTQKQRDPFG